MGEATRPPGSDPDQLLPRLTRILDYFQALAEVGKSLTRSLALTDVLATVDRSLRQMLKPQHWSLLLVDEARGDLYFEVAVGEAAATLKGLRIKLGEGIAGWVARHREPVAVARVADDPRFARRFDQATNFQTASVLCVPLVVRDRVLGVIELVKDHSDPEPYGVEHLEVLAPLADFAAIAIDNARTFERARELTIIDDWTGLYNTRFLHRFLDDETRRARRYHRELSVIFLDLDRFKAVNDTHGHATGSTLLQVVATAIRAHVRDTDRSVRYGGDEFVVVMPETPKTGALLLAERLRAAVVGASLATSTGSVSVTASFGVAAFPADGGDAQAVLAAADRAMYVAKSRGRNLIVDASGA